MNKINHNELLNTPLLEWPLQYLCEHKKYLEGLLEFPNASTKIIDDIRKIDSYIEIKRKK